MTSVRDRGDVRLREVVADEQERSPSALASA